MSLDVHGLRVALLRGPLVRVLVAATAGSVPRGPGTSMIVRADGEEGTIGGGALERDAVQTARGMLAGGPAAARETVALGPRLGQCCGGSVTLVWECLTEAPLHTPWARAIDKPGPMPPRVSRTVAATMPGTLPRLLDGWLIEAARRDARPVWIWGAGHVGRSIAGVLVPFPDLAVTWIDLARDLFPDVLPEGVSPLWTSDPPALAAKAPSNADHLVLTRSHDLDLAICHALLSHGFASVGLIGSATKMARFRTRLTALGHAPAQISRIACPIGDPSLGKHPQAIAVGVAAALIRSSGTAADQASERDATG